MSRIVFPLLIALISSLFFLIPINLEGQSCPECRFSSYVFDSVSVSTVKFGEGPDPDGTVRDLEMDVYEPFGDTASLRPVVIFAFG